MTKSNFYLFFSKKSSTFVVKIENSMSFVEEIIRKVEKNGVLVERDMHGIRTLNRDVTLPYLVITLFTQGSARLIYDMREFTQTKNQLCLVLPGHVMHPLECSDDCIITFLCISQKMLDELRNYLFSHDYAKFHYNPLCSLTDIQTERLLAIVDQLDVISGHTFEDLNHRNHMLLAQMSVGYEFLNYYRREQDMQVAHDRQATIFAQFCDLVVEHHRAHKDIQFYAEQMNYHPKYLSRVIRNVTNGVTPKEWIGQFVVAQAKRLIETNPDQSLKQIAFTLGFTDATSFYRYFKRVTGIYPQVYRERLRS